jgi:hypothetical protein
MELSVYSQLRSQGKRRTNSVHKYLLENKKKKKERNSINSTPLCTHNISVDAIEPLDLLGLLRAGDRDDSQ